MNSNRRKGGRGLHRLAPIALLLSALAVPYATAQQVASTADIAIDAQPLENALIELAKQSGIGIFAPAELVRNIQVQPVRGTMSMEDALRQLLDGTGLGFQRNPEGGYVVMPPRGAEAGGEGGPALTLAQAGQTAVDPAADPGTATEPTTETVTSQKRGGIEEIIVTARRREESVQDVPISITALTAEDMKVMGIRNAGDMEGIVVGLNMSGGGNGLKKDSNPFIRGIGQRETKVTLDPGVGSYLDGIYLARTAGALLDTVGMESIEVLRGPQGTLFGKNVAGGAISYSTIKPKPGLSGSISANMGNYGRGDLLAVANIPLIDDSLLARFTVSSKNSDGMFINVTDGTDWGGDNRLTGIAQFRWLPSESLVVDLLTERTRIRETPRPSKCMLVRPIDNTGSTDPYLSDGAINPNYNPYRFNPLTLNSMDGLRTNNGNPYQRIKFQDKCREAEALPEGRFQSDMAGGKLERNNDIFDQGRYWIDTKTVGLTPTWEIGDLGLLKKVRLKSISAWREVNQIADEDLDATDYAQVIRIQDGFNETSQVSQELQLSGTSFDDRLFFSTGIFYFREKTPQDNLIRTAGIDQGNPQISSSPSFNGRIQLRALEATRETLETDNEAHAWYGQLDFKITPQLEVTAGVRYTTEERWTAYTKAYAMGPSMASVPLFDPNCSLTSCGADFGSTLLNTRQYGMANVFDWRFYSPEFTGWALPGWDDASDCTLPYLPDDWFGTGISQACVIPGFNGFMAGFPVGRKQNSVENDAWTPMASIKYHAGETALSLLGLDDAMAYVTYSKGFTSGGVTSGAVDFTADDGTIRIEDPVIYKPQFVDNYEVGLKLQALDHRMQANMAMYYSDFKDMQITSVAVRAGIPNPFIDNVGKSVVWGFEGEFVVLPLPDWRILLNGAYTNADFKVWNARTVALNFFTGLPEEEEYSTQDRSDEPMPRVPKWQGYLMTDYTFRLPAGGVLTPLIAARYSSEIYHGFDRGSYCFAIGGCSISAQFENPVYSTPRVVNAERAVVSEEAVFLDARLTYLSADGKIEIAAWGKNLTNKRDYLVGGIPLVDIIGTASQVFADPRTFGLTVTYNFGAQ